MIDNSKINLGYLVLLKINNKGEMGK